MWLENLTLHRPVCARREKTYWYTYGNQKTDLLHLSRLHLKLTAKSPVWTLWMMIRTQYLQLHSCGMNITEVDTKCQYLQQHQCCLHCECWHKVSVPSTALMCSKCCECWHKVSVPSTWSCMAMINCHHLQLRTTGVRSKSQELLAIARYFSPKHPQSPPNQRAKRSNYRNLNLTLIDIKNSPYSWLRKPRQG